MTAWGLWGVIPQLVLTPAPPIPRIHHPRQDRFGPRLDPNPGAYRPIVALAVIALVLLACVGSLA